MRDKSLHRNCADVARQIRTPGLSGSDDAIWGNDVVLSRWRNLLVVLTAAALCGCAQQPAATTGSIAPVAPLAPPPNTTTTRLDHLAWNTAWAESCGFYFDNAKLKASYLNYEASAGTPTDQMPKIGGLYDRTQSAALKLAAAHLDQCTDQRLEHIRASMGRYLSGDFSPGEVV